MIEAFSMRYVLGSPIDWMFNQLLRSVILMTSLKPEIILISYFVIQLPLLEASLADIKSYEKKTLCSDLR